MRAMVGLRKAVVASLCAAMAVSLGACGSSSADSAVSKLPDPTYKVSADTPAWKSDKSKDNTLTWYVNADWWNKSFGKDLITAQIRKDLHLNINFVTGDDTKLNTYFASGKLPDVITTFDSTSKVSQTASQWAYPLQELADKYDPYFNKVAKKAIKEKFPDLIPFGFNDFSGGNSSLETTVQDMLGVPITGKGNSYYDRDLDSDYIKWLDTFRKVHADGNISDDSFADDADTFKEKVSSGKYATMMMDNFVSQGTQLQTFASQHPDEQYVAVNGIMSTEGRKPTLSQSGLSGWSISYITKQSKNAAKAIQTFEYLLSDYGQMLTNFGIEGKTYTKNADGTVSWTAEADKIRLNDPDKWQTDYRMGEFVLFGHDRYKGLNKASFVDAITQMQKWGQSYLTPEFQIENIQPDTGSSEARALTAIQTNWSTTMVSLIRADSESGFQSILAKYKQFQKSNSIDAINKIRDQKIKANVERLKD
ncbi:MAG: sugar ABC transporter substrate-binding protein [Bifidobacterium sp.]|uniref:Sugar ABC transporter substrate-binding protein n=1 Tax=Bifidobacterium fermentum TaxID=3059035 RepID=A0AB39UMP5_9BIFI